MGRRMQVEFREMLPQPVEFENDQKAEAVRAHQTACGGKIMYILCVL